MLHRIINCCKKYEKCLKEIGVNPNPSEEIEDYILYFNIELAKNIIISLGNINAKQIAKTILGYVEDEPR